MVAFTQKNQSEDEDHTPAKVTGSADLRQTLKEKGQIAGSFSINGVMLYNFMSTNLEGVIAQINTSSVKHGVRASLTEDGHLELVNNSRADIRIGRGTAYAPSYNPDLADGADKDAKPPKNEVLEELGLEETESPAEMSVDPALQNPDGKPGQRPLQNPQFGENPDDDRTRGPHSPGPGQDGQRGPNMNPGPGPGHEVTGEGQGRGEGLPSRNPPE